MLTPWIGKGYLGFIYMSLQSSVSMCREVCSSLLQFQDMFRDHGLGRPGRYGQEHTHASPIFHNLCSIHVHVFLLNSEHERSDLDTRPPPQDPQSLRDEILNRPPSRQPHARKQPDEGQLGTIKYYRVYANRTQAKKIISNLVCA